jgi:hypothetical protein
MAHSDKFHSYLTAGRKANRQATQIPIFAYTAKGTLGKTVVTYVDESRLVETLDRMHTLNPGRRYATQAQVQA